MKAVVLAAGEGTRMRPFTAARPKVLLPAGPEPLLGRLLRQLAAAGVTEATLVVGYMEEAVREAMGDGGAYGLRVRYAVQDPPRGTGDALRQAGRLDEDFLMVNGDCFLPDSAIQAVAGAEGWAVAAAKVADATRYGALRVEAGRVTGVAEKSPDPPSDLVNAGVYRFTPSVFDALERVGESPRGEVEVTDALTRAAAEGTPIRPVPVEGWLDVGRPWDLLTASERALDALEGDVRGEVEPGATLKGEVFVAEGARVRSGAYIEGPVYVGPGCDVGPNCYVRGRTTLVGGNRVGNAVEVKNSLLMEGATVGHLSYVGDSVLGRGVNFGAGTKVANLRHDGANVRVHTQGAAHDSGRRKLGALVGDGVHTGINTSLNVGVVLPAGGATLPGEAVLKSRF